MTLRDILNPWGALREARAEADFERMLRGAWERTSEKYRGEYFALRAELYRLKRGPKRDAKGRFVG